MNYARYSRKELEALAPGSAALRQRLAELAMDVKLDLHAAVAAQFKEIVTAMNAVGHELRETPSSSPGEIDYAQGDRPNPFFLGCDITISSGYLGTSACDASIELQTRWEKDWPRSQNQPDEAPKPTSGIVTPRGESREVTIPPVA